MDDQTIQTSIDATRPDRRPSGFLDTLRTLGYAIALALVIRTLAFEPFSVPSESMLPTLEVGDYFFVSKYAYGYSRHSLPFSLPLFSGRLFAREPARGDIVVFKLPRDDSTDYVKRLIGLPGDRVQVRSGIVYVNDQPLVRRPVASSIHRDGRGNSLVYRERTPEGAGFDTIDRYRSAQDDTEVFLVAPGHYFMMGDNRDNSRDSRFLNEVGQVPAENLVGRAELLFFSTKGTARLWEVWKWPATIRYTRLLTTLRPARADLRPQG
ncbi:MAG: signal peptidase I [Alphaproteobacteria bacterium]|nr:signal peptidase I [Alphaproteobacteria bacterium]